MLGSGQSQVELFIMEEIKKDERAADGAVFLSKVSTYSRVSADGQNVHVLRDCQLCPTIPAPCHDSFALHDEINAWAMAKLPKCPRNKQSSCPAIDTSKAGPFTYSHGK
jgi:hypothetical protein